MFLESDSTTKMQMKSTWSLLVATIELTFSGSKFLPRKKRKVLMFECTYEALAAHQCFYFI
jgi:hypothetical protein